MRGCMCEWQIRWRAELERTDAFQEDGDKAVQVGCHAGSYVWSLHRLLQCSKRIRL